MVAMYRSLLAVLILCACGSEAPPPTASSDPLPPSLAYPELFHRVAKSELYEPKDWVDMTPMRPVAQIEADYLNQSPLAEDELAAFVAANFTPAEYAAREFRLPRDRTLTEHIEALWPLLTRSAQTNQNAGSLLPLPNPYIVPGGRFREVYYWDTYFTMLGLGEEHAELKQDIVDNFATLLERYGRIPNGNRSYYLSRSQPPFFHLMVGLLNEEQPEQAYADYLGSLMIEHAFWTADAADLQPDNAKGRSVAMPDGSILQRYYDDRDVPRDESYRYDVETAEQSNRDHAEVYRDLRAGAESGWDYSSRWFVGEGGLETIQTTAMVPVDLNALLYGLERAIAAGCQFTGDTACAERFTGLASTRKAAINTYLWNEQYYTDYSLGSNAPIDHLTAASLYPLFLRAAEPERAAATLAAAESQLLAPGGILPTLNRSGEQWDAPNGWAPHQWIATSAARNFNQDEFAAEIATRWVRTVSRGFCESGKLTEKYNVIENDEGGGGEYPNQDGFGWTNGVTARFIAEDANLTVYGEIAPANDSNACELPG